jgi:uncharacterized protein (DUF1778 family)
MNDDAASSRRPSITVRLTPDEKRRFAAIAAARGQSESELGLAAVRMLLELSGSPPAASAVPKESASDRITIRLRPGDRQTIAERARLRSKKASTYIAALVRAHVASNPPLTTDELTAFKTAVAVLAGFGRLMALVAKGHSAPGGPRDLQQDLSRTRALVAAVEQRLHEFVRASLNSWECSDG